MDGTFLTAGDTAVSVEVGNDISIPTSQKVSLLFRMLQAAGIDGIVELLPAYCSVTIQYDPSIIHHDDLVQKVKGVMDSASTREAGPSVSEMMCDIPVLYGGEYGYDIQEVADYHKKTVQDIIDIHSSHENYTYMLGFAPGMGYLGSQNGLRMPRRKSPRLSVEEGSIIIWENQSIIFPITGPTGWNVIGKTPVKIFDISKKQPFLLSAGLWIKFFPVNEEEYREIAKQSAEGKYLCRFYDRRAGK
ncbi:MAG: 5-oxoprolinase subunit PxpB [Synergistaceae bacterium]|nr:5-oxoprolinase subunit PxpB [Synergistaceae bacterium]